MLPLSRSLGPDSKAAGYLGSRGWGLTLDLGRIVSMQPNFDSLRTMGSSAGKRCQQFAQNLWGSFMAVSSLPPHQVIK